MNVHFDHVVLWVADPLASAEFFEKVVGLAPVRLEEFRAGKVPFPSVRISGESIIDLMAKPMAQTLNAMGGKIAPSVAASAGHPVHHICLAMDEVDFTALRARLDARGMNTSFTMERSFGARGIAPHAFYFTDLDGNVFEARYYA
jgi:catechol 2,3-dioxygenase-like lactoylglutathione lyase family enzyme